MICCTRQEEVRSRPSYRRGLVLFVPSLLILSLTSGCLTSLAISAVAGSGGDNEHVEKVRETAKDVAEQARDAADDVALSAHDAFESLSDR